MERVHWHQLCKEVGLPQLGERWSKYFFFICSIHDTKKGCHQSIPLHSLSR
jgi:hypothetical protein